MKKCRLCGEEVQAQAKKCKHCGGDLRSWFRRHWILSILGGLLLLIIVSAALNNKDEPEPSRSGATNTSTTQTKQPKVSPISANTLIEAYTNNEVKADNLYKGKRFEITGTIRDISIVFGETYIVLSNGKDFNITDIQCFMKDSEKDKVANLNKGNKVTLIGKVDGKSLNVEVRKCTIK